MARLNYVEQFISLPRPELEQAVAVCAAVEAFQAAEQAYREVQRLPKVDAPISEDQAWRNLRTAKTQLLEVNLG